MHVHLLLLLSEAHDFCLVEVPQNIYNASTQFGGLKFSRA